ncbi:MAG: sigma factor-like helix-turn-helix DNA-binding protein [Ancrocorticia sp.]|uniref:sigma factor-like helix-turn-helix DNA-binding protein n=1 Tax=Ancrocorticia sp. TaxID=2593684 RepID=UPI003F8E8AC3
MFVLTMDQVDSRHEPDRVPELLAALESVRTIGGFARTVGDEIQGALVDTEHVVRALQCALRLGGWHIGVGCGAAGNESFFDDDDGMRSARGPAFLRAREAVEASKKYAVSVAVVGEDAALAADVQALLQIIGVVIDERSAPQREVVELVGQGLSGQEIALQLGISEASVSRRRTLSRIFEEEAAWPVARRLLEELDREAGQ